MQVSIREDAFVFGQVLDTSPMLPGFNRKEPKSSSGPSVEAGRGVFHLVELADEIFSTVGWIMKGGLGNVLTESFVEVFPDVAVSGMGTVDFFPRAAEVIVYAASIRDVIALALGVGNVSSGGAHNYFWSS